jgi:hypothetical protein
MDGSGVSRGPSRSGQPLLSRQNTELTSTHQVTTKLEAHEDLSAPKSTSADWKPTAGGHTGWIRPGAVLSSIRPDDATPAARKFTQAASISSTSATSPHGYQHNCTPRADRAQFSRYPQEEGPDEHAVDGRGRTAPESDARCGQELERDRQGAYSTVSSGSRSLIGHRRRFPRERKAV